MAKRETEGLVTRFFLNFYVEAFDLLVQGGERYAEAVGGFGLVPVKFLQHLSDDPPLAFFDDVK